MDLRLIINHKWNETLTTYVYLLISIHDKIMDHFPINIFDQYLATLFGNSIFWVISSPLLLDKQKTNNIMDGSSMIPHHQSSASGLRNNAQKKKIASPDTYKYIEK